MTLQETSWPWRGLSVIPLQKDTGSPEYVEEDSSSTELVAKEPNSADTEVAPDISLMSYSEIMGELASLEDKYDLGSEEFLELRQSGQAEDVDAFDALSWEAFLEAKQVWEDWLRA